MLAAAGSVALAPAIARAQTLRGSNASVDLMYAKAHARGLEFFRTPEEIQQAASNGKLKMISVSADIELDEAKFPYVLPNTLKFADSLAAKYRAACGERLVVTSGTRPLDKQPRNASPKSVHPTGMAIDFRKPRTGPCLKWLRKNLVALEDRGVIEATEERRPPHFHVAVLRQVSETRVTSTAPASQSTPSSTGDSAASEQSSKQNGGSASTAKRSAGTPATYRVRSGDNLWTIAQRHHTTSQRLRTLNHLRSTTLRPGQTLRLR